MGRDCIGALAKPLRIIFKLVIQTSTFPDQWKKIKVGPILKLGDKNSIDKKQAISVL